MYLVGYDCITAAGSGYECLMQSLYSGVDNSAIVLPEQWKTTVVGGGKACLISEHKEAAHLERFRVYSESVWRKLFSNLSETAKKTLSYRKTLIILSSTKGFIEDYIWQSSEASIRSKENSFQKIISNFVNILKDDVTSVETLVISNACASSHVAIESAKNYLNFSDFDSVIILAADLIGPFIYSGFQALKVLSTTSNRPFASDRDGLQLGEALAVLVFQKQKPDGVSLNLTSIASDMEGGSVTKPSMDGTSLLRCLNRVVKNVSEFPDFSIGHGTGTIFNDLSEAKALSAMSEQFKTKLSVSGIKWSIGHTLGASGALDVIAASEVLKSEKLFALANSNMSDSKLVLDFVLANEKIRNLCHTRSAVVTSLGFGGIHAALRLEKQS